MEITHKKLATLFIPTDNGGSTIPVDWIVETVIPNPKSGQRVIPNHKSGQRCDLIITVSNGVV